MDWTKPPKKRIQLTKGFSMGWFDLSSVSLADLRAFVKNPPAANADQHAHNVWFEAQMEIQRRNR